MPNRPIEAHHRQDAARSKHPHSYTHSSQHGKTNSRSPGRTSVLLGLPSESLTHITSYLDPSALFALSRTNRQLHAHVKDDNTWRRAYLYQFLGISPESDLLNDRDRKGLLLRREEPTWRHEFVLRYNLRWRWERSRNQPVTHIPLHSNVVAMHLMPSTSLLTASLKYGIVARSYPLTGKILRGFLDGSGTANGFGLGNPNTEFNPHVTAVALASEGRNAKVLWGFLNGEVAVTIANRAMDGSRPSAAKHVRCTLDDCHEGKVTAVAWGHNMDGPVAFVTGGSDGRVKLWDARKVKCLWTSEKGPESVRNPCVKVTIDVLHNIVIAAMESGVIKIWCGLDVQGQEQRVALREISVPPSVGNPANKSTQREISVVFTSFTNPSQLSLLVSYKSETEFYRVSVDVSSFSEPEITAFGDSSSGAITMIRPIFTGQEGESSFVITGDQLGCISIFDWHASSPGDSLVASVRRFEAHEDGCVTALAWNSIVLVSGSSRGTVKVWDALSTAPLRSFASLASRPAVGAEWDGVSHILLEKDVVLVSVGSRVMAWRAGPVDHDKPHAKGKQVRVRNGGGLAKWQQQIEMYRDIAESRLDMDKEQSYHRRVYEREREQHSTLAHLGLSEVEAVEYVLMLSRDEEERRRQSAREDDGVFMADFDDLQTPISGPSASVPSELSTRTSSRASSFSTRSPPSGSVARSLPRTLPSPTHHKIQVSPRVRPEPMEAGFSTSPLGSSLVSSLAVRNNIPIPSVDDTEQFPAVSRTPSSAGVSVPSTPASPPISRRSVSGSVESPRSAWSTPLRASRSSSSAHGSLASSPPAFTQVSPSSPLNVGPSLLSTRLSGHSVTEADREDEDLRFALELSLAEALSQDENV